MPSRYIEPLDLTKLKNYFIGNDTIFAFIFIMIYSYGASYFGMSNKVYYFILMIGVAMFGVFFGESFYVLSLMLIGGFVFKTLSRFVT